MSPAPPTVADYLESLSPERGEVIKRIREKLLRHLPEGFEEQMTYGMIGFVVPHRIYPKGYHTDAKSPLPFINLASQKKHVALYHMGLYSDPELLDWFTIRYEEESHTKLDIGKSCIRFKKLDDIPYELIGELAEKMTPQDWIEQYESGIRK